MTARDDGGAAFPIPHSNEPGAYEAETGMSKRDHFAGQVLPSVVLVSEGMRPDEGETFAGMVARLSYEIADAMLAARSAK